MILCHTSTPLRLTSRTATVIPVRYSKKSKRRKDDLKVSSPHLQTLIRSKNEISPSQRALHHFDVYYGKLFSNWNSIRLGLLTRSKHCALINNFAETSSSETKLFELGCRDIRDGIIESVNLDDDVSYIEPDTSYRQNVDKIDIEDAQINNFVSMNKDDVENRIISSTSDTSILHDFVPVSKLKGLEDFVEESKYYEAYEKESVDGTSFRIWKQRSLQIPKSIHAMVFPSRDIRRFPKPTVTSLKTFDYYCLDASSLFPVLALGIKTGDSVLDTCSGPGGKALIALQTLRPSRLVCNDESRERLKRVINVLHQYLGTIDDKVDIQFMRNPAQNLGELYPNSFDKVLCDVPCFTDRIVTRNDENNIFHPRKNRERIQMPQLQTDILKSALKCVKPGGFVVYSTCSMSPTQNDGVVYAAMKALWEETNMDFATCDLSECMKPYENIFRFAENQRYGQLILPYIINNFGPMYFAKIKRLS